MIISVAGKKPISSDTVSENTLSLKECRFLVALYDRYSRLTRNRDYNCRPLLDYYTLRNVDTASASRVYDVSLRCKEEIKLHLIPGIVCRIVLFVACPFSGDSHIPHGDNERREHGRWVANHTLNAITQCSFI